MKSFRGEAYKQNHKDLSFKVDNIIPGKVHTRFPNNTNKYNDLKAHDITLELIVCWDIIYCSKKIHHCDLLH